MAKRETMNIARKISTATLGFNKTGMAALLEGAKKGDKYAPVHLYNIAGKVHRVQQGESTYGPWVAFRGDIMAVLVAAPSTGELKPGDSVRSSKVFLPEPFSGMLESAISDKGSDAAEFAVEVWIKQSDTATGYEYDVKPVVKIREADEIGHLLEAFNTPAKLADKTAK